MPDPLCVVRHAESLLGARNVVNGDPAVYNPLTERGRGQAEEVGRKLADVPFEICFTTDFPRTKETAELIVAGRDVSTVIVPDLNDPRLGDYEGKAFQLYAKWMDDTGMDDPVPGGGESQRDCVTRYARGWRTVAETRGPVLVVAHAFPISVALTLHEDEPPMLRRNYERDPVFAEVNVLDPERLLKGLDVLEEELAATRNAPKGK
jgi:probable phosphoglycerate mutase